MMTDIRQTIQLEEPRGASLACACLFWPAIVAVILIIVVLLSLAAGYARQYAFAQPLQFAIFAVAGPALLALGTSWRPRSPGWPPDSGERSRRLGARPTIRLAAFIAVTITWRPPATVNALARDPALVTAEMITLLAAGTGLWLELTNAPHGSGQLPRPVRTAMAAAATWTNWVPPSGSASFGRWPAAAVRCPASAAACWPSRPPLTPRVLLGG